MGTRCADHVTPLYPQKLALTSPNGGVRSVGIVRSRTKATEFSFRFSLTDDLVSGIFTPLAYKKSELNVPPYTLDEHRYILSNSVVPTRGDTSLLYGKDCNLLAWINSFL